MSKYLDEINSCTKTVLIVADELERLSSAFFTQSLVGPTRSRTGNAYLGETLAGYAIMLREAADQIDAAVGERIDEDLASAQRSSETLLAAILLDPNKLEKK
jgi:hypothetical protein